MFLIIGRSSWLEGGFRKEGNVFVSRRALFGRRSTLPTAQPFGDSSRAVRPGNSVGERLWTKCSYVVVVAASFVVFFSLPFRRFCARASAFRAGGENGGGSPILISLAIARKVLSEGGGGGGMFWSHLFRGRALRRSFAISSERDRALMLGPPPLGAPTSAWFRSVPQAGHENDNPPLDSLHVRPFLAPDDEEGRERARNGVSQTAPGKKDSTWGAG